MTLSALLASLPPWLCASLVVGSPVACVIGAVVLVRRRFPYAVLRPHNDVTGLVFAAVAAIYGIILAFVVVEVWSQYSCAQTIADDESSEAYALYRDLNLYPNTAEAAKGQAALRVFVLSVVRDEYPAIKALNWDSRDQALLKTQNFLNNFLSSLRQITPRNLQEQAFFSELLKHANNLEQNRVKRRLAAQSDLPGALWAVVILGGVITLSFVTLLGLDNFRHHLLIGMLLAIVIGGAIFVIVIMNFPFSGEISINPDGYNYLIELAGW